MEGTDFLRRSVPALALMGTLSLFRAATRQHDPDALATAEASVIGNRSLTHRWVQAGRHQIHTVVVGSGPPLVMLHGHGGGIGVWFRNIEPLSRYYQLHLVDWLGWGRSDRPRYTGRGAEHARDWWLNSLEDWRRAMGLNRFFLLGHSLGGWLAAEYAMAYPQHVRHLIVENCAGLAEHVSPIKGLFYRVSPQRMVQAAGPFGIRLVERGCADQAESCMAGARLVEYYYELSLAPLSGQIAFEQLFSLTRGWLLPIVPRAAALRVPTTVIWGLNDDLFRIRDAHRLRAGSERCELVLCPEAYHSPHFEEAARFNETLIRLRWLQDEDEIAEAR